MIDTVLFDWDGTLLNSNELIRRSHLHVLEKYFPGVYDAARIKEFNGFPLMEIYQKIWPEKQEELVAEYRNFSLPNHDKLVTLFPDVEATLATLKEHGFHLAVVSTKKRDLLQQGLDLFDLGQYFEVILGGGQFKHPKPHPESLILAMEQLQSRPEKTIMVGDNWQDIQAAHNAGIAGIFVEWSETTLAELEPIQPDKTVSSMSALAQWLLEQDCK